MPILWKMNSNTVKGLRQYCSFYMYIRILATKLTWVTLSIEAPSKESNKLPKEPNKIWRDFVKKKKEYENDKEEMNQSKNYHQKS